MVSTPEGITNNIPMDVGMSGTMMNTITRKSISQFCALLDFKKKLLSKDWGLLKYQVNKGG